MSGNIDEIRERGYLQYPHLLEEVAALKRREKIRKRELIRRRENYEKDEVLRMLSQQINDKMSLFDAAVIIAAKTLMCDGRQPPYITIPEVHRCVCRLPERGGKRRYSGYKRINHRIANVFKREGFIPVSSGVFDHKCWGRTLYVFKEES